MTENPTFGLLATRHPEHDAELWRRLSLLYTGGYAIRQYASDFLPQVPGETQARYAFRVRQASYINYLGQILGYLAGALFKQPLVVAPAADADNPNTPGALPDPGFYERFAVDADLQGTSVSRFMRSSTIDALLYGKALVGVDMPPAPEAANRSEEEQQGGGRAYVFDIPVEELTNWELGRDGKFVAAVLHRRIKQAPAPWRPKGTCKHRFKLWTMRDGFAEFTVYETRALESGQEPSAAEPVPVVVETTVTSFREIPILALELPDALWAGNKCGPLAEEHFRRRSDLAGAMARSLVAIAYVKRGPEVGAVHGAMPSETQQDPHRGEDPVGMMVRQGYVPIGENDSIGFAEPAGTAYKLASESLHDLRDEIFRTVHAMALSLANTGAAVGRSGESKREDRSATEIVLEHLGDLVRGFGVRVYDCIARARGEDVVWSPHGLDRFDAEADAEHVETAALVGGLGVPSATFKRKYMTQIALALVPNASPEEKATIADEIRRNTPEEEFGALRLDERDEDDDDDEPTP